MVLKIRVLKKGLLVDSELFLDERCDINALGAGEDDKAGALLALKDVGEAVVDSHLLNCVFDLLKEWRDKLLLLLLEVLDGARPERDDPLLHLLQFTLFGLCLLLGHGLRLLLVALHPLVEILLERDELILHF